MLAGGCQSLPERVDRYATSLGMERRVLEGERFRHVVYQRRRSAGAADSLHVYIEGDGRPWIHGAVPAGDPTPRNPYALSLMARDPAPSAYLGRPCYFGLHTESGCGERYWTGARYSPDVVDSMAAALVRLRAEHGNPDVILVGYSGGGALATLIAGRVPGVTRIVTIAANLDIERWTARHGYRPLNGSLNPMASARMGELSHLHYAGGEDSNVPDGMIRAFADRHGGRARVIGDFDHRCCWHDHWPALLYRAASPPKIATNPGAPTTEP